MDIVTIIDKLKYDLSQMGANFVSLKDDKSVIVENQTNKHIWEVPFVESEGVISFDGEKAQLVSDRGFAAIFEDKSKGLKESIQNLYLNKNYDEAISELKQVILDLPHIELSLLDKKKQEIVENKFDSLTQKAMHQQEKYFEDYVNQSKLFSESGEINKSSFITASKSSLEDDYSKEVQGFLESIQKYRQFKVNLANEIDEKLVNALLEHIDWTKEIHTEIPKTIAIAKSNGHKFDSLKTRKSMIKAIKDVYYEGDEPGKANPFIYNYTTQNSPVIDDKDGTCPPFLKFHPKSFNFDTLKEISAELDKAFASKDKTQYELDRLGNYRMIVEYMIQSKQINDNMLAAMISDFNKDFVFKRENEDDGPMTWRSRDEQMTNVIKGMAGDQYRNLNSQPELLTVKEVVIDNEV